MNKGIWSYLRREKQSVAGWLQRVDAEIIGSILLLQEQQNIHGGCVEIGVHHGKSFIPLCMALQRDEVALCIDLFANQSGNLDGSGKGDLGVFQSNLKKFKLNTDQIRIFEGSSEKVTPEYILGQVGQVRFFSVDGGHWQSIVQNDLALAEMTLAPGGVIALVDYCRAEWPDVTFGYALWQAATQSDIVPFAAGSNKLFLCRTEYAARYRAALNTKFLGQYFTKSYRTNAGEIDCYRVEPIGQDEDGVTQSIRYAMKIFRPDAFSVFNRWF